MTIELSETIIDGIVAWGVVASAITAWLWWRIARDDRRDT